jgi:hypothetical protein
MSEKKIDETTPETTEEANKAPVDPNQVGEMLPQEMMQIQQVRGRINQCLLQIGHLEVQKAMKLSECESLERDGQAVIAAARERLGIDPEDTLQITPDGRILKMPSNVVQMQPKG